MIESRPSILELTMGTECYDRPPPAPYSFRGGLLWSSRELAKFSLPSRPAKPIPKSMPEATNRKTSWPCSASTRGLSRLLRSTNAPSSAATKPVTRLVFFMHSPPARIPAPNDCDRKAGIVSPQLLVQVECDRRGKPDKVNVSAVPPSSNIKTGRLNLNYRQVSLEILCGEKDPL